MASALREFQDQQVHIITADGRNIIGKLSGYDQLQNLILSAANEHVFSPSAKPDVVPLGLYVIRGDNVAAVGLHVVEEGGVDVLTSVQCEPIGSIRHEVL
uniref:U6 snRNA-associated Sm-like protein LSm8 n=1 Tax=Leptocylindrus danicus TaxID=163516 RepID=A0A7S2K6E7_9STRA